MFLQDLQHTPQTINKKNILKFTNNKKKISNHVLKLLKKKTNIQLVHENTNASPYHTIHMLQQSIHITCNNFWGLYNKAGGAFQ